MRDERNWRRFAWRETIWKLESRRNLAMIIAPRWNLVFITKRFFMGFSEVSWAINFSTNCGASLICYAGKFFEWETIAQTIKWWTLPLIMISVNYRSCVYCGPPITRSFSRWHNNRRKVSHLFSYFCVIKQISLKRISFLISVKSSTSHKRLNHLSQLMTAA